MSSATDAGWKITTTPPPASGLRTLTPRTRWRAAATFSSARTRTCPTSTATPWAGRCKRTVTDISTFIQDGWGGRLIRGWDEEWLDLPQAIGDQLGRSVLGAAPGQTVIADSTTVVLYKLIRAALAAVADPARTEIVLDTDNFPTDRYLVEGIAREEGLTLRWIEADPAAGVTPEQVRDAAGPATAVVLLSHVAYRSGLPRRPAGRSPRSRTTPGRWWCGTCAIRPVRWRLDLDGAGVDFAAGCTYKYLNGGPGSPAFAYVNARHLPGLRAADLGLDGAQGRVRDGRRATSRRPASGVSSAARRPSSGCWPCAARWTSSRKPAWRPSGRSRWNSPPTPWSSTRRGSRRSGVELASPRDPERSGEPHHPGPSGLPERDRGAVGTGCHPGLPRAAGHPDRAVAAEHQLRRSAPGHGGNPGSAAAVTARLPVLPFLRPELGCFDKIAALPVN